MRQPVKARDWGPLSRSLRICYPRWLDFGAVIGSRSEEGREDFLRYWESSVDIPGPAIDALSRKTQSHSIYLVVGVIERELGTLIAQYCSSHPTVSFWASTAR